MITIEKSGLFTTIQDLGRAGYQKYGVIAGGAMDPFAHRVANILVGNEENEATIESTMIGPTIRFNEENIISICGGNSSPAINGEPIPMWRPITVKKGDILQTGTCVRGFRTYIAFAGGLAVPKVMNSRSTFVRGKLGGYNGRALEALDEIPFGPFNNLSKQIHSSLVDVGPAKWRIPSHLVYSCNKIRVIKGRHYSLFPTKIYHEFLHNPYKISPESDRMGYRLQGSSLILQKKNELVSEAVTFGTVQVTSDGNPVILLADRQTTGGYPKVAQVISADFPLLAQKKPGDTIQFEEVSLEKAQQLLREREKLIAQFKRAINLKYR